MAALARAKNRSSILSPVLADTSNKGSSRESQNSCARAVVITLSAARSVLEEYKWLERNTVLVSNDAYYKFTISIMIQGLQMFPHQLVETFSIGHIIHQQCYVGTSIGISVVGSADNTKGDELNKKGITE